MNIIFHHSDKPREISLANAFANGARGHGHEVHLRRLGQDPIGECELAIVVGVKSAKLWQACRKAGQHTAMLDKGYSRHRGSGGTWEYWRVSFNAHHPTGTTLMTKAYPGDRLNRMGLDLKPWRKPNKGPIVIAGSSAKYHAFYGLSDPTRYTQKIVRRLAYLTEREIIYRPKPSWREAVPIRGTRYSPPESYALENIGHLLETAHCLITHGSNACFDAMVAGVPSIVLGDGVALPISTGDLDLVEDPPMCRDKARVQLLANLAYHQWNMPELASGEAWETIGKWL